MLSFTVGCSVPGSELIGNTCTCPADTYLTDDGLQCQACPTGSSTQTVTGSTSVDACGLYINTS